MRQAAGHTPGLKREVEFGGAPLEVVTPFGLGIEIERTGGEQVARGRGVGEIEDVLSGKQALVSIRSVTRFENLIAQSKASGEPAGEIRTDSRSRSTGGVLEHRPMADELEGRDTTLEVIVSLRQPPDVVVTRVAMAAGGDRDLIVQSFGIIRPHFLQPVQTEPGFIGEIRCGGTRAHLCRKVSDTSEHHAYRIGVSLDELHVIAGIPPASRGIDGCAGRGQGSGVVFLVESRGEIYFCRFVVQVTRRSAERTGNVVRAVAFVLVKR